MDRREQLAAVFTDTQDFYTNNRSLADAVQHSRKAVRLYAESDYPELPEEQKAGSVSVTKSKTFEAAMRLHNERPSARIAVLNFASATNPGGGVKSGSSAQEESLCRCSTLYPTLNQQWLWRNTGTISIQSSLPSTAGNGKPRTTTPSKPGANEGNRIRQIGKEVPT